MDKTKSKSTTHDPFKHLVDFSSFAKEFSNDGSSSSGSTSLPPSLNTSPTISHKRSGDSYESTSSATKRKYESKVRLKRDPEALREDSKNRQKNLRKQMKDLFHQLALSIRPPLSPQESTKTILQKAVEYIQQLNLFVDCVQIQQNQNSTTPSNIQPPSIPSVGSNPPPPSVGTNPFISSPLAFPFTEASSETERELESLLFPQNRATHNSSNIFSSFPSLASNRASVRSSQESAVQFEATSTASGENQEDDLLFFESSQSRSNDLFFDLTVSSPKKVEPELATSPPDTFSFLPTKIQKTEDQKRKELFSFDLSPPNSPPSLISHNTSASSNVSQMMSSPSPSPNFESMKTNLLSTLNPTPLSSSPNMLFNWTNSVNSNPSGFPQPSMSPSVSKGGPFVPVKAPSSPPSNFQQNTDPFISFSNSSAPPLLKQEPITLPNITRKLDEKAVLNAFGKLELGGA